MLKQQEINRIVYLYTKNNLSIQQIAKQTGHKAMTISKYLKENGVVIEQGTRKFQPSQEDLELIRLEIETNKKSYAEVARLLKKDVSIIKRICKEQQYVYDYHPCNKNLKHDFFENIDTKEKAWLLGLLWADGSVRYFNESSKQVRLSLSRKDEYVIEQIKEWLCIDSKTLKDNRSGKECSGIEFISAKMCDDLAKFGIVPNKTYLTESIHLQKIPSHLQIYYVLGLLDGDGSIVFGTNPSDHAIAFTSKNEQPVREVQLFIDNLIGKTSHNKIQNVNGKHFCTWRGRKQILSILDKLYDDKIFCLKRKYEKYLKIKAQ